jgi:hypothetical protein
METDYALDQFSEQRRPIFDTVTVAQGAAIPAIITFFGHTKGGNTQQITNLVEAFKLPPPGDFDCYSLRLVPIGCALADLISLMQGYNGYLKIGPDETPVSDAPFEYWAGGAGVHGEASALAAGPSITNWTNGLADPRAVILFDPIIHLSAGERFSFTLEGTSPGNATAAVFLRCYLDGKRRKGMRA